MFKKLIFLFLIVVAFNISTEAKEFRGIIPLHSNKEDVIRILGKPTKEFDGVYFYRLEKEEAIIWLKEGNCDDFGFGWDVPSGTVTSISVLPSTKVVLSEFISNEKNFKSYLPEINLGFIYLNNEIDGLELETLNGYVTALKYEQEQKDSDKRCPRKQECCIDFFPQDEFLYKSLKQAKERLDFSASSYALESDISRMYLIAESNSETKARQTVTVAKKYLINKYKFNPTHIVIASGKTNFNKPNSTKNYVKITVWIKPIGGFFNQAPYAPESVKAIED